VCPLVEYLVDDLRFVLERAEPVCKPRRDEESIPFAPAEDDRDMLSVGGRTGTNIDGDIENRSATNPDEFVLSIWRKLKMQTSYRAIALRKGTLVLDKN
jgi:hypothetical protein